MFLLAKLSFEVHFVKAFVMQFLVRTLHTAIRHSSTVNGVNKGTLKVWDKWFLNTK